jgi:hypothetical protein
MKVVVKRREDWRGSSYNNFALDKATVAACPIQIDDVRLPLWYRAGEKPTVRKTLTVATRWPFAPFPDCAVSGEGRQWQENPVRSRITLDEPLIWGKAPCNK